MINQIAIISKQTRALGKNGDLLWKDIPTDLTHFRDLTRGAAVIMGRSTWDSLPPDRRPLPKRVNIVITRDVTFSAAGAFVANSLEEALALAKEEGVAGAPVWIIGGGQIYTLALPFTDRLYLTLVDEAVDGDTYYPDYSDFEVIEQGEPQEENGHRFQFVTLARRASTS